VNNKSPITNLLLPQVMLMVSEILVKKNCTMPVTPLRYSDRLLAHFTLKEQALYSSWISSCHYRFHMNKLKSWTTRNCRYSVLSPHLHTCTYCFKKHVILTLYISQDGFHEKWDHGLVAELTMEHVQQWAINTVVATSQRPYELQNTWHF